MSIRLPRDFIWGAASAAPQIEGYSEADGGGASVWDVYAHTPGRIDFGENGDTACGSYYRYAEDIALVKGLGADVYRFSTSWARCDPEGNGRWNEAGFDYYERVADECLRQGVRPVVTLYHWELPQAAEERGGWISPDTAERFADFAGRMAGRLRGRVGLYFTLNEPQCTVTMSYGDGSHAPGRTLPLSGQFGVLVQQQRAHGLAMRAVKAADPDAAVGIVSTGRHCFPDSESREDIAAARLALFDTAGGDPMFTHSWLLDPIFTGRYPEDCAGTELERLVSRLTPGELETILCVPDCVGYNMYHGRRVRAVPGGYDYVPEYSGFPRSSLGWPITPEVLDWSVRFLCERYRVPAFIAENGVSCADVVGVDGKVRDPQRIDFLTRYLAALSCAIENGADVRGWLHWSLTDNFEWSNGYYPRFGLVYTDYRDFKRIPKDSYYWLREQIAKTKSGG